MQYQNPPRPQIRNRFGGNYPVVSSLSLSSPYWFSLSKLSVLLCFVIVISNKQLFTKVEVNNDGYLLGRESARKISTTLTDTGGK